MASTDLVLTLGASPTEAMKTPPSAAIFELTLGLSGGSLEPTKKASDDSEEMYVQASSVSSFSNGASVKRERDAEEEEDDGNNNPRKKLRLTKEQSALLEESFKHHITLNPQKEKQALARELNLRPRQVEVWFQNRRARTKLKQTEMDCDFLKKWCETLTEENRKLQREVHELKAQKHQSTQPQPFYMQLPAATLTMCPSCERIGAGENKGAQKPIFFNPLSKPSSAAC